MKDGSAIARRLALGIVALSVAAVLTGCGSSVDAGGTARAGGDATDGPPRWNGEDSLEGTVSFADGPALAAATGVTFSNDLGMVWDWDLMGDAASTTTGVSPPVTLEMVNAGNGCRAVDERAPYEGASTDDGAASTALVEERLADAEIVAGPVANILGLSEPLGEDGATYTVARALGQESDGRWVLVTARAFVALGAQQVITVSCATGGGIDLTQGQLAMNAVAYLQGLDRYP